MDNVWITPDHELYENIKNKVNVLVTPGCFTAALEIVVGLGDLAINTAINKVIRIQNYDYVNKWWVLNIEFQ